MNTLNINQLKESYIECKENSLFGKWIIFSDIKPLIKKYSFSKTIGISEKGTPIYQIKIGSGKKKILIWSQMHGNESTGTKALFDLLNYIHLFSEDIIVKTILKKCTIIVIPMLNPDGALAYTRVNANNIDLNRDVVNKKAKESIVLRTVLDDFKPNFCFNLHDQRTIFGVKGTKKPASISFLAPSEEKTRKITNGRKQTMNVIVAMNKLLQQVIPKHIGRYTDEFYPTATGDNFQKLGYNTILIESGHYANDYNREEVRKFNFFALLQGIYHIAISKNFEDYLLYFEIPNNQKNFFDVIHRYPKTKKDIAFQYSEKIENNKFLSVLKKEKEGDLSMYLTHNEVIFKE